jgi:hypothetical protein
MKSRSELIDITADFRSIADIASHVLIGVNTSSSILVVAITILVYKLTIKCTRQPVIYND